MLYSGPHELIFDNTVPENFRLNAKFLLNLAQMHIPLVKDTYARALQKGSITVGFVPPNQIRSAALWYAEDRHIQTVFPMPMIT
jgi:hypothetical protein